jgi:hypothetical protein
MRWGATLVCVLSVGAMGCPHAFGRGGTIDRAARKDAKEVAEPSERGKLKERCPPPEELEQLCEDPADAICPRECLEEDGAQP